MIGVSELLSKLEYMKSLNYPLRYYVNHKRHTFVNEGNFDNMAFMVDLRFDIRTKEMLNITPCKKCCFNSSRIYGEDLVPLKCI